MFVAGAAAVGNSLTGVRKHEDQIIEPTEEAVQDDPCTVDYGKDTRADRQITNITNK